MDHGVYLSGKDTRFFLDEDLMRSELSEGIFSVWPERVYCAGVDLAGKDLDVKGCVTRRNAADSFASASRRRVASVVHLRRRFQWFRFPSDCITEHLQRIKWSHQAEVSPEMQVPRLECQCWGSNRGNSLAIACAEGPVLLKSGCAIF